MKEVRELVFGSGFVQIDAKMNTMNETVKKPNELPDQEEKTGALNLTSKKGKRRSPPENLG
jgi:hypothetical protein